MTIYLIKYFATSFITLYIDLYALSKKYTVFNRFNHNIFIGAGAMIFYFSSVQVYFFVN